MSQADSQQHTCPSYGAELGPGVDNALRGSEEGRIVIIERPPGWTPASELDAPGTGLVLEVVELEVTDAATFIRQYNAASLDEHGVRWAALTREPAVVGSPIHLVPL